MGQQQRALAAILARRATGKTIPARFPAPDDMSPYLKNEARQVYETLGGILPAAPFIPASHRKWDIFLNGYAVELDEDAHFNRYRKITLASSMYYQLPRYLHETYADYCDTHEGACRRHGGFWASGGSVVQFGQPAPEGNFRGNGSPRWKQRAFYDFLKDMAPLTIGVLLVRISIWDKVQVNGRAMLIGDVLDRYFPALEVQLGDPVYQLVQERVGA
jgi:hypothetical protein